MRQHLPKFTLRDGLVALIISMLLTYIAVGFWPRSYWFTYSAVEVVSGQEFNKPFLVTSIIDGWKRDVDVKWNDVLRCDLGDGNGNKFISNYESSASIKARPEPFISTWVYQGPLPNKPGTCFIDSSITIETLFGFKKQQTLQSNTFELVEPSES